LSVSSQACSRRSLSAATGYGIVGDIVVGIVGAFIGGWIFREAHWASPIGGLGGVILIAFIARSCCWCCCTWCGAAHDVPSSDARGLAR